MSGVAWSNQAISNTSLKKMYCLLTCPNNYLEYIYKLNAFCHNFLCNNLNFLLLLIFDKIIVIV